MGESGSRMEFRPKRETRRRLEELRQRLSKKTGKTVSMSWLLESIVEEFLSRSVLDDLE